MATNPPPPTTPLVLRSPPSIKPNDPLMGTTEETYQGSGVYYYKFGGTPKADWSGLATTDHKVASDLCYRSADPVKGQKSIKARTNGLSKKFSRGQNMQDFQTNIFDHLVKHGLDTISFIYNPRDDTTVINVVKHHAQLTGDLERSLEICEDISQKYDQWDHKNNNDAKDFLLNSLSENLLSEFKTFHSKDENTFAALWLKLIHHLIISNSKNFDNIKGLIRNVRPSHYPGQNIKLMSAFYIEKANELTNAGYFDNALILNMVDGFLCASSDKKGTFHYKMNQLYSEVEKVQSTTIFLNKTEQDLAYTKAKVTYKQVCAAAVKEYNALNDIGLWEPSKLPKDKQTPAATYLAKIDKMYNLVANMSSTNNNDESNKSSNNKKSSSSKPTCYNCGGNHSTRACPKPRASAEERKIIRHKLLDKWRLKAPKDNESHTTEVNGKIYKWCDICGNWTTTHNTANHGKFPNKSNGNNKKKKHTTNAETNLLTWEPSAWIVEPTTTPPDQSTTSFKFILLVYIYMILTLPIILGIPIPTFNHLIEMYNNSNNFMVILQQITTYICNICQPVLYLLAPLCWMILGYVTTKIPQWYQQPFNPIIDAAPISREERRELNSSSPSVSYKLKSARDHKLHRKYPFRLRNNNEFNTRSHAPTIEQRQFLNTINDWTEPVPYPNIQQAEYNHPSTTHLQQTHSDSTASTLSHLSSHPPPTAFSQYSTTQQSKGGYIATKGGYGNQTSIPKSKKNLKAPKKPLCSIKRKKSPKTTNIPTLPENYFAKQYQPRKRQNSVRIKHEDETKPRFHNRKRAYPNGNLKQSSLDNYITPSPKKKSTKYRPVGTPNHRNFPNNNLTVKQFQQAKRKANTILLTGTNDTNVPNETMTIAKKISMMCPARFQTVVTGNDSNELNQAVWDTGASICVTYDKSDFISYSNVTDIKQVKGIGSKQTKVVGQGIVSWSVHDANGSLRTLKLKAYHIPDCKTRLISTNSLLKTYEGEHLTIDSAKLELSGIKNDPTRTPVLAFNHPTTLLPTSIVYNHNDIDKPANNLYHTVSTVHNDNLNLTEAEKELLRWHQRLGHLDFKKIKHLMRTGVLSHTQGTRALHTAASKLTSTPKCAACLFGKQTVKSSPGTRTVLVKDRAGILKSGNLLPGNEVSVDHFISSVRGRLFEGYNKGYIDDKYIGGCIFVDHASSYIHVEFQSSLSSHETLRAKLAYERTCRDSGIIPQAYMSDNGKAFTSKDFVEHLSSFHQVSKLAGVGAHHHNAQAERAIRTIMSIARTMMIHSGIHWPDVADPTLWPMAVKHACFLFNHVPSHTTGLSPTDIFTKVRWPQKRFMDLHVWGCPVYVLDKSLQDGKKIPKWKPRSRRSIYMGISHKHASSVPLCLNTSTGAMTPQFHVVFDDWFATVAATDDNIPNFSSKEWNKMFGDSVYQYILDENETEEEQSSESDLKETIKSHLKTEKILSSQEEADPTEQLKTDQPPETDKSPAADDQPSSTPDSSEENSSISANPNEVVDNESTETESKVKSPVKKSVQSSLTPKRMLRSNTSRPKRNRTQIERLTYEQLGTSNVNDPKALILIGDNEQDNIHVHSQSFDYTILLSSKKEADPDIFSFDQATNSEHKAQWIKAAIEEIRSLESLNCWNEILLSEATEKVLPGTWVFKVKRAPDGSFKKWKARYCIRGDLQEGDFDTYAPVVHFSSVRLFLAWSLILGWETFSIDFSSAFVQANLEDPTYIHLPRGFRSTLKGDKICLKLNKSIYGLSVAPRLWFQHLWTALKKLGLKQSKHDACLLFRKDLIIICYVDDLGIQAPNRKIVDTLVQQLKDMGFSLTLEGSFSEYLGIQYVWDNNKTMTMTQQGLIQKIIEATGMENCNPNKTPCTKEGLGTDELGERMDDPWNYRSIVGMLLYLSTNTRPDISFAVSQVARFSHNPKKSHASAVKMIVRYLSGTKDRGVIYKRPDKLTLECFVDADFAGLYGRENPENPISVKSRTGYIVSVAGCFILCKSQLQSTIALSTSEAEYGALSQAMRTLIPIRETILEMINNVDMVDSNNNYVFGTLEELKSFPTIVYEDNTSALTLANKQRVTSRTKHWSVKFHFFWDYINNESNNTKCVKVSTKEQKADYLTKGLTKDLFQYCRHLNQGW